MWLRPWLATMLAAGGSPLINSQSSTSWTWKEDLAVAPAENPNVDHASVSQVVLAAGGGYRPAVDPASVDSTSLGLVGMYHFDDTPVDKGIEPDASSSNLSAVVVGSQVKSVAGKYDMALSFPGSKAPGNLVQIPADWWMADQPQQGCAVSAWIYIPHGGTAASGYIYERVYDGFELQFDGLRNQTHCSVRDAAGVIYTPEAYQHTSEDFGVWKHVVCSYNDTVGNTTMYVDGKEVGTVSSKSIATTGLNHGDHQMFGFGARPTDAGAVFLPLPPPLPVPLSLSLALAHSLPLPRSLPLPLPLSPSESLSLSLPLPLTLTLPLNLVLNGCRKWRRFHRVH